MAIASNINIAEPNTTVIASCHADGNRLYVVLGCEIDVDLPPLAGDFVVRHNQTQLSVNAMDVQVNNGQTVVLLLMDKLLEGDRVELSYRPTQWRMSDAHSGADIDAFSASVYLEPVEALDPTLRLKARFGMGFEQGAANELADIQPEICAAHEFLVQLHFNAPLDTSVPLDIHDFRAESADRWLRITSAKYQRSADRLSRVQLELAEPMVEGEQIAIAYRSPGKRLRTAEGEALAPFHCEARVQRRPAKEEVAEELLESELRFTVIDGRDEYRRAADAEAAAVFDAELREAEAALAEPQAEVSDAPPLVAEAPISSLAPEASTECMAEPVSETAATPSAQGDAVAARPSQAADLAAETATESTSEPNPESTNSKPTNPEPTNPETGSETAAGAVAAPSAEPLTPPAPEPEVAMGHGSAVSEDAPAAPGVVEDIVLASAPPRAAGSAIKVLNLEQQTARVNQAIAAKSSSAVKLPPRLTVAAKLLYLVPIVVLVWLVGVVGVFVATMAFDFDFGVSGGDAPSAAINGGGAIARESCRMESPDGSVYEGQCAAGERDGYGVYQWSSGNRYEGEWAGGQRHGKGKLTYATGAVYEGDYRAGREHGEGRMSWPNGARYEGGYKDGRFHGKGMYLSAAGNRYEGIFDSGSMTQDGACTMQNGETYTGPCRAN